MRITNFTRSVFRQLENLLNPNTTSTLGVKSFVLSVALFLTVISASAQVSTNSGSGLASSYPSLNSAITALNSATISSPVTITLLANETAPVTGYTITASGTSTNTITINGGGRTVTAATGYTAGSNNDGIFKLVGADWITIENFILEENASNTVAATGASNTMTEWAIALLYASTTNGAENCRIQNNSISLSASYDNTFGIYSNSTHNATAPATDATATGANGGNNGLKIYGNTINNIRRAILIVGPTAAGDQLTGIDIGGNSLATGNTITNFGGAISTTEHLNSFAGGYGIMVANCKSSNVAYNSLTSTDGSTNYSGSLYGVVLRSTNSTAPTGTNTTAITNNILDLRHAEAGTISGIAVQTNAVSNTSTLSISCNKFSRLTHTAVSSSLAVEGINTTAVALHCLLNGNIFDNLTVLSTLSTFTFISASYNIPASGTKIVNNNNILTGFSKASGANVTFFLDNSGGSDATSSFEFRNNNVSNITIQGTSSGTFNGLNQSNTGNKVISGNIFRNISHPETAPYGGGAILISNPISCLVSGNQISQFDVKGAFWGINTSLTATGT